MNRHFNWLDKPVTWGAFLKLSGICTAIGAAISGVCCALLMEPAWWIALKDFVKRLFKK